MVLGAVSGIETSSLRSSLGKSKQPGRTEPILAPHQPRHGLARAQPDSPALHPLHSLPHFCYADFAGCFRSFHGHKLPRQAGKEVRYPVEIP